MVRTEMQRVRLAEDLIDRLLCLIATEEFEDGDDNGDGAFAILLSRCVIAWPFCAPLGWSVTMESSSFRLGSWQNRDQAWHDKDDRTLPESRNRGRHGILRTVVVEIVRSLPSLQEPLALPNTTVPRYTADTNLAQTGK
jgi:hypothetical protein